MSFSRLAKRAFYSLPELRLPAHMSRLMNYGEVNEYIHTWKLATNGRKCKHSADMPEMCVPATGEITHEYLDCGWHQLIKHYWKGGSCEVSNGGGKHYSVHYYDLLPDNFEVVYNHTGTVDINPKDYNKCRIRGQYAPIQGLKLTVDDEIHISVLPNGEVYKWRDGRRGRLVRRGRPVRR